MTAQAPPRHWAESPPGRVRLWPDVAGLVAALLVVLAVVTRDAADDAAPEAADDLDALALFGGLPQDGFTLGRPDARATLVIYTALDAPRGSFDAVLPALVERFVRPGRLTLQLRTLSRDPALTAGDGGALRAAYAAQAAGLQDRLWPFVRVLGLRSPGYVDDAVLADVAGRIPGLDVRRMRGDAVSPRVAAAVERADAMARAAGVTAVPTFILEQRGRRPTRLVDTSPDGVVLALERLLRSR
jgi:protein-disulfide isomerase